MKNWDPEVREVLIRLVPNEEDVLGADLLGSYAFGSVATGTSSPESVR
jgi:hypothetical protein